jgi:DNA-binding NarL/FixJ family response regulator
MKPPPGLAELGLIGALEERGRSLSRPGEFAVTVVADGLPPLSARRRDGRLPHRRRGDEQLGRPRPRREREILALMAEGHGNTYIADYFVLSLKTVRNHVSNVMAKIGASTRAVAVARARDAGLRSP